MDHTATVILANGSFPKKESILSLLDKAKQIICCDGAANKLLDSGREPSIIIGDLDSVRPEIKDKYREKLYHIADQTTNDLTKAINWCTSQNIKEVIILGATGEREDHAISNIALLSKYQNQINVKMYTDYGLFIAISDTTTLNTFPGQQVSIFSQDPDIEISSEGLKYPLENLKLTSWWMGSLNEAISNTITIILKEKGRLMVYLLDKE